MRTPAAALLDAAAVAVFAGIGRASHDESVGPVGIAETAWPFWAGAAAGWLVTRAWRHPDRVSTGVGIWAGTLVGGMLLRAASGAGVQVAFVIVTAITLAILLLGWRGVATLVQRRRSTVRGRSPLPQRGQ